MKLLRKIEIPNYIRQVELSKSRAAKYYVKGKKEPTAEKYKSGRYQWKPEDVVRKGKKVVQYCLWDVATNKKVVVNSRTVGTPKTKLINGQDLFGRATTKNYTLIKEMDAIKNSFVPYVNELEPITEYPIRILCQVYDHIIDPLCNGQMWDVGNRFLMYGKCFEDVLQGWPIYNKKKGIMEYKCKQIITDDNVTKITQPPVPLFYPISKDEERKLIFFIYKDEREIVKQNKHYNEK